MRILLNLTLSGSALALVLLLLRYVLIKRMPSTVYYYAWLLVLLRFVLPLPGLVPQPGAAEAPPLPASPAVQEAVPAPYPARPAAGFAPAGERIDNPAPAQPEPPAADTVTAKKASLSLRSPALWLGIWAAGTAARLGLYVVSYALFTVRVRRSLSPATLDDRRAYRALPGRKPRLCRCAAFDTPLMFGVLQPVIALPERAYDGETLQNILRHELTHYRRRDTLYKWFGVAVLSSQWFNPLSYLIRRELNRACELSCDEVLLRGMDRAARLSYGNTLLNMAAAGALPAGVVATTFSTEKRNLKERLEQIMKYKKSGARLFAAALSIALLLGFCAAAGPARAAETAGETAAVSTVDDFLAAIGPDRIIELKPGTYDLSTAADYGGESANPYYVWSQGFDGYELEIRGVKNLTIRGAGQGETTIAAIPRYANVLRFSGCADVRVEALTAGHTQGPGWCMGGVLYFDDCERSAVDACGLYGCGVIGVHAVNCNELRVTNSEIYECSYSAVSADHCRGVRVENCDVHDHGTRAGEGEALSLFDAAYSEDFVVYKNRIHDNRAQFLLAESYTKRLLFLSNDVTGNRFGAAAFRFNEYGATVDGCRFEGNDVRAWYQSDGIYAGDIEGNLLEGALFMEMSLRDIDPDSASPLASVGDPTAVPKGGAVTVTNVDELLAALGPDRTILLEGALFDLSAASNYGGIGTSYYYWAGNYDGPQLVIHDVDGLTIRAVHSESGATTLSAVPRYADVLAFRNCKNLTLDGFTAGHTKEPGLCSGGVLNFQDCENVRLEKMRLYGCGVLGIQASNSFTFDILRTEIYECSQGGASFFQCEGLNFSDCSIHDVPSPALIFRECGDKRWNGDYVEGLDSEYDVTADGTLVAYERPWTEEDEYHGAVEYTENPYATEPPRIYAEYTPQARFAYAVKRDIAANDWEALADRIAFPLQFFTDDSSFMIRDREEYMGLVSDGYFTNDYITRTLRFQERIAAADVTEFGACIFGDTCLEHLIAFDCSGSEVTEDNLKIRAISVRSPFWPGSPTGNGYALAVPPTPAPALRVMFYTMVIENGMTVYPGDGPIELHVEIPAELAGAEAEWFTDNPAVLRAEKTGADTARITCLDDGSLPQTCKLGVRCGNLTTEFPVYCRK